MSLRLEGFTLLEIQLTSEPIHLWVKWVSEVAQSCLTLCDPMDCSLSGSSAHGIFQARVLEWIAISFSRGSSQPRNQTRVSRIAGRRFAVSSVKFGKFLDIIFSKNFFYIILFSFCDFSDMKDTSLLSCTSNTLLVIYSAFQIRKFSLICHQVH